MELVVRGNRWFTIGENGAEMRKIKKGDIVFNHIQTDQILKNGYVTANGGRGRIANANGNANPYKNGTAYVNGTWGGGHWNIYTGGWSGGTISSATPTINYTPQAKKSAEEARDDFRETVDYIEILIDRIERKIDELDTIASSAYRSFSERNSALTDGFAKITEEIDIMNKAYQAYVDRANKVGLSQTYKDRLMNGELRIEDITDENLKNQIDEFTEWYEIMPLCLAIGIENCI